LPDHFDCPNDIDHCPKKKEEGESCFIYDFGDLLIALLDNSFIKISTDKYEVPEVKVRNILKIPEYDLSTWKGELCLIESESIIISNQDRKINVSGVDIDYNDYWRGIIKGMSFLSGHKTSSQIIERTILECIADYRTIDERKEGNEDIDIKHIGKKMSIVSNLLSRSRLAINPSRIARSANARDKYERFIKTIGLREIVINIEGNFSVLDNAITQYTDFQSQDVLKRMAFLAIPLAIIIALGTIILIIELEPIRIALGEATFVKLYGAGILFIIVSFITFLVYSFRWKALWMAVRKIFSLTKKAGR
jgi:hypothetical protein